MSTVEVEKTEDAPVTLNANDAVDVVENQDINPQTVEYKTTSDVKLDKVTEAMASLEAYMVILKDAGQDGISAQAGTVMATDLKRINRVLGHTGTVPSMEEFGTGRQAMYRKSTVSLETLGESFKAGLKALIQWIKDAIEKVRKQWGVITNVKEKVGQRNEYLGELAKVFDAAGDNVPEESKLPKVPEGLKSKVRDVIKAKSGGNDSRRGAAEIMKMKRELAAAQDAEKKAALKKEIEAAESEAHEENAKRKLDAMVSAPQNPNLWIGSDFQPDYNAARPDRDLLKKIIEAVMPRSISVVENRLECAKRIISGELELSDVQQYLEDDYTKNAKLLQGFTVCGSGGRELVMPEETLNFRLEPVKYGAKPSPKEVKASNYKVAFAFIDCHAHILQDLEKLEDLDNKLQDKVLEVTKVVESYTGDDSKVTKALQVILLDIKNYSLSHVTETSEQLISAVNARCAFHEECYVATL